MNLRAAERAEESSAFDAALKYLAEGIARLPDDPWAAEYELSFALTTKMGLMQALSGRPDDALATLDQAVVHGGSRLDKTRAYGLKVRVHILKGDLHTALIEGLVALRAFGIDLPPFPSNEAVAGDVEATLKFIEGRSMESLCDLPMLADPEIAVLHSVLEEMISSCYFLASNNFGFCVMKILHPPPGSRRRDRLPGELARARRLHARSHRAPRPALDAGGGFAGERPPLRRARGQGGGPHGRALRGARRAQRGARPARRALRRAGARAGGEDAGAARPHRAAT
ncbi:hypothetical protein [Sorangium cellulosum]|nr:hypothetical protein [Sorangium cellulosum]